MSAPLRILVVDGNPAAARAKIADPIGCDLATQLARNLTARHGALTCEAIYPCDDDFAPPADPARYDGAIFTGSVLHAYEVAPEIDVQLELVRALLDAGVDVFGLCWGLQIGCTALGGRVALDPEGPEIGMAHAIRPTEAGRLDPVLRHRPARYDSHAWHVDAVVEPPPGATILAINGRARIQALRATRGRAAFLGVQYHPEYTRAEIARMGEAFRPADAAPIETLPSDETLALEPLRWLETLRA